MGKKGKGKGARKPTYGAATRLARLVLGLRDRRWGRSFESITRELGITERTLLRYIDVCARELVDEVSGKPLLEVCRWGERRVLRLAEGSRPPDASVWEAASLYFLLTEAGSLDGTVLREVVESLLDRTWKSLSPRQRERLENLDRKIYSVSESEPGYGPQDEELDVILRALIDQLPLRLELAERGGRLPAIVALEPYTLLGAGGRLLLAGLDRGRGEIALFAVEDLRRVSLAPNAAGELERFAYPPDYHPGDLAGAARREPPPPDGGGEPPLGPGSVRLRRRGPRRASRTSRNKRGREPFGKAG